MAEVLEVPTTIVAPASLLEEARRLTERWLGDFAEMVRDVPVVSQLTELLETLQRAEEAAAESRTNLIALAQNGAATTKDYRDFETLRINLYRAQLKLRREILNKIPREFHNQIPRPEALSPVTPTTVGTQALSGFSLGAVPVLVVWAAAVLAVLVALGLIAYIAHEVATSAETIAAVATAHTNGRMYRDMTAARLEAYRACIASGQDPDDCAETVIDAIPSPRSSLPRIPSMVGDPTFWTWLLPAGAVAFGFWIAWKIWGQKKKGQSR